MICFKQLSPFNLHLGITDRTGGKSTGVYGAMNTNFYNHEQYHEACMDIKIALDDLGITAKTIVATRQTHSSNILLIDNAFDFASLVAYDVSSTALSGYSLYSAAEYDGLMTNRNDVVLMTFYADCVPLYLYDPMHHAVSVIHSGWRGTASKIADKAIERMKAVYESSPDVLLAGIGQAADKCCYEVDDPVYEQFQRAYPKEVIDEIFNSKGNGKFNIDLKLANQYLFMSGGILPEHIEVEKACTMCEPQRFHSHRRANGGKRGSMSLICQLGV